MEHPPNDRAATLVDVAKLAKVSRATAARALGGYGLVTDATRERVLAAANELNYRVNELARSMRSGRSLTIGVVVADIANSFFNTAIRAIIETASGAGYQILVLNTDDDIERERGAVRVLTEKRVDGLIVVPASRTDIAHLKGGGDPEVPLVLLDRYVDTDDIDYVISDDFAAAQGAIQELERLGHTKIGLLVATAQVREYIPALPDAVVSTVHERYCGALEAMPHSSRNGAWVRFSRGNVDTASQAALEILQEEYRPTAILATNEEMALGVVQAANNLGIAIGSDLSIIAFDDAPWARVFNPPISVIRRPVEALGSMAVRLLLRKMEDSTFRESFKLKAELVMRGSVRQL